MRERIAAMAARGGTKLGLGYASIKRDKHRSPGHRPYAVPGRGGGCSPRCRDTRQTCFINLGMTMTYQPRLFFPCFTTVLRQYGSAVVLRRIAWGEADVGKLRTVGI